MQAVLHDLTHLHPEEKVPKPLKFHGAPPLPNTMQQDRQLMRGIRRENYL